MFLIDLISPFGLMLNFITWQILKGLKYQTINNNKNALENTALFSINFKNEMFSKLCVRYLALKEFCIE